MKISYNCYNMLFALFFAMVLFESSVESTLWTKLIDKTHEWSIKYSHQFEDQFNSIVKSANISVECNSSIWRTVNGIQNLEVWAIHMINSWGSFPPTGVGIGTSVDFGSYDQCLAIEPNEIIGKPQYCLIDMKPPLPKPMPVHHNLHHRIDVLPKDFNENNKNLQNVFTNYSEFASFFYWISLRTGICTPSKCSENDMKVLSQVFTDSYGLELIQTNCETKSTETTLNWIQIIAILFFVSILLLSLSATLLESLWFTRKGKSSVTPLIIELFSIKRNFNTLLAKRSSETLPCLHGIRVISMIWIIIGHSIEYPNNRLFGSTFITKDLATRIDTQLLLNGGYAVVTFFFIGGMLTSYITLQLTTAQLSKLNFVGFLLARAIRLIPQILIITLLTFLLPLAGFASGPIWNQTINPLTENCSNNWWWNVLFIQNWFHHTRICITQTWYLANDMQLHWLSLLFLVPVLYSLKFGFLLTSSAVIVLYFINITINYWLDLPPGMTTTGQDEHYGKYYIEAFYLKPWSHFSEFFIGFLLGIIAYNKKFKKLNRVNSFITIVFIITGLFVSLLDTYHWNTGKIINRALSAFIFPTSHVIWSLSLGGLIWMCISGNGGIINKFLSAHIFTPFSRMTYSAYLLHGMIVWIFVGSRRQLIDANRTDITYMTLLNLFLTYSAAFIFALLFETPILRIQSLLKKKVHNSNDHKEDHELSSRLNSKTKNNNDVANILNEP